MNGEFNFSFCFPFSAPPEKNFDVQLEKLEIWGTFSMYPLGKSNRTAKLVRPKVDKYGSMVAKFDKLLIRRIHLG